MQPFAIATCDEISHGAALSYVVHKYAGKCSLMHILVWLLPEDQMQSVVQVMTCRLSLQLNWMQRRLLP